jgi:hypothetical protein
MEGNVKRQTVKKIKLAMAFSKEYSASKNATNLSETPFPTPAIAMHSTATL